MSEASTKPVIFISYSHKDEAEKPADGEQWLTYVQSHLQPAVKGGIFEIWVDGDIEGGADWRADIDRKLNSCNICLLLVSRHALSSDFILDVEVKRMLERRESDGLPIYPLVLSPFATATVPWLMAMNLRPPGGKPLSTFALAERDAKMAEIVDEIAARATAIAKWKGGSSEHVTRAGLIVADRPPSELTRADRVPTVVDGALKFIDVDISGLPETAYERLVGRDKELKRLDDAWADRKTNILSLIAEGGAGKSALVNEWLKRMQADNYRGAEAVLGWSFYSQGSKGRATSADEFLNWALDKLGIKPATTSATAKAEAIAEALARRRVLLVLDGVEPLQHGLDRQQGELRDAGLRALLRRFSSMPPTDTHGLVVLTSRLPVKDIARWQDGAAPVVDVEELSDEAGAALLRDNGVWGTDKELQAASRAFGGHPLALGLLASFLKETQFGDVRRRDHIRAFFADRENPRHDHARRVMESYEKEWLASQPVHHAIMQLVGLFDRPASGDCLRALRRKPAIPALTDAIVDLSEGEWERAIARLREVRLLAPGDPSTLDTHPLVREWFGEHLKQKNGAAWKTAHGRLFEYLRAATKEGNEPTLEELAPLYQAIAHGCHADLHDEAFSKIYLTRICRSRDRFFITPYSIFKLGAAASDLAAVSHFFDLPYVLPASQLGLKDRNWILNQAALLLVAQGRLAEAIPAQRSALSGAESEWNWFNVAVCASNLSRTELLVGEIVSAISTARNCIQYADHSGDPSNSVAVRACLAAALHASASISEAGRMFAEAEIRQQGSDSEYLLMEPLSNFHFCDFLLSQGRFEAAKGLALRALDRAGVVRNPFPFERALDTLCFARVESFGIFTDVKEKSFLDARRYPSLDDSFSTAARNFRAAASLDLLPLASLARATLRRSVGDWEGAARDLDEVEEIAKPGPMRLYLCDMALERARLAFARSEAFAPLHGMLDDNPPKPVAPDAAEAARLTEDARENLTSARKLITDCGYHRRDAELAELEAVLRGEKKFADLPPRV